MSSTSRPLPPELQDELSLRTEGQELAQVWELLALADPVAGSSDADAVWSRVSAQIAAGDPIVTPIAAGAPRVTPITAARRAVPARRWHPAAPWALAATLAIVAGLAGWQATPVSVQAAPGEQRLVTLPDGSTAELNAGSSLRYARGFRALAGLVAGDRTVELDGEAFFSVVRSGTTFAVNTGEARITVLGTQFVVQAHLADSLGTRVAVEEGRVHVQATAPGSSNTGVELGAGQGTRVAIGARAPESVAAVGVERMTQWRRGGLAFVDQPLDAIFRELERRYAVDIRVRDVVLGDELLSVYYSERPSIERVLTDLCTSGGLRFSRTSRGFEITPQAELPTVTP